MKKIALRVLKLRNIAHCMILLAASAGAVSAQAAPMVTDAKLFAGNDGLYSFDVTLTNSVQYNAFVLSNPAGW